MRVLELLEEIEDIVDTASGFPLTGKIMVDAQELLEIVKDIRTELPEEIQQAQWIKNERDRILDEARVEYETIIRDAETRAEELVDTSEIMEKARSRSGDMIRITEENVRQLKMSTYDYVDGILFDFQEKVKEMQEKHFEEMFRTADSTFCIVNETLLNNREEIKEMAYKTTMNLDDISRPVNPADEG